MQEMFTDHLDDAHIIFERYSSEKKTHQRYIPLLAGRRFKSRTSFERLELSTKLQSEIELFTEK